MPLARLFSEGDVRLGERGDAPVVLVNEEEASAPIERERGRRAPERGRKAEQDRDLDVVDEDRVLAQREADREHLALVLVHPGGALDGVLGGDLRHERDAYAAGPVR